MSPRRRGRRSKLGADGVADRRLDRLFVPNTHYNLDLSDHGNPTPGTPVTLWGKWHPGKNQTWRFEDGEYQPDSPPSILSLPRHAEIHACTHLALSPFMNSRVSGRSPRSDWWSLGLRWRYENGSRRSDAAALARLCTMSYRCTYRTKKKLQRTYHHESGTAL